MKKLSASLIIILFIFSQSPANAQILRFGISGGISSITSPDSYKNSVDQNGFGFGNNIHFGAQFRIDLPLVPLTPIIFLDYHLLRGDGQINGIKINNSQDILSAGIEGEYFILPLPFIKPYISLNVALNNIGKLEEKSPVKTTTMPGYTRYGGALGIGTVITILPVVDLDVAIKYQTLNLVGKSDGESNISMYNLNIAIIF